jgi:hypothetical protein
MSGRKSMRYHLISLVGFRARFFPSRLFITRVLILPRLKEEKKGSTTPKKIRNIPSLPLFRDERW